MQLHRLTLVCCLATASCAVEEPPGRSAALPELASSPLPEPREAPTEEVDSALNASPGQGDKLASIAMRSWIYLEPRARAQKVGYLRAGAVIDRARDSAGTDGCAGGWYRVVPRGYVCVGKGATLDLEHPVVRAAVRGPRRDADPYSYVVSRSSSPPHLYFKLPTREQQQRAEGKAYGGDLAGPAAWTTLPPDDPVPSFLSEGNELPTPYGSERKLHYAAHAGRAKAESAFGLMSTFEWTGRRFGLTTELDLIALDRTKPAPVSGYHGVVLTEGGTPGFAMGGVSVYRKDEAGNLRRAEALGYREGVELTGKREGGMGEIVGGGWVPVSALRMATLREGPTTYTHGEKKWIDVSIKQQILVAYEGTRPVFATLVSTGRGELGDPAETTATARGIFSIRAKHVSGTMDGEEGSDAFDLRDVPWIQYFHEGYAIHGAYWHDKFGQVRSHGCVNTALADARWLFDWTDPVVPPEWHGAVTSAGGGTIVWVHA